MSAHCDNHGIHRLNILGARVRSKRARVESMQDSATMLHLLSGVGCGTYQPTRIADLASHMVEDGFRHPVIAACASLGCHGKHPQNIEETSIELDSWSF